MVEGSGGLFTDTVCGFIEVSFGKGENSFAGLLLPRLLHPVALRWSPTNANTLGEVEIDTMVAARRKARADRDFAEADRIRDELVDAGVILEDKPDETIWRRK